ncbi:unnamed protein product [Strongylus vulgaris]|uniref:Uncharacterized protein n=1 Tax=Strongylus vulgaris TaxID=40348 RepID=A0A3P7ID98_STRVU|nr:unnamed protein product [Strongylus vulgaris]
MGVRQIQRLQRSMMEPSTRMMSVPHSAASVFLDFVPCKAITWYLHCFEKVGAGGDCPGVVGAKHETISITSRWRVLLVRRVHGILCNLTALMTPDAVEVLHCAGLLFLLHAVRATF